MNANAVLARLAASPPRTKMALGCALALAVALFAVFGALAHTSREALFATPLQPEQLTEVEERLAEWNVPYTASQDNVAVDGARRNDVLLKLSLAGVPHAHIASTNETLANVGVLTPQTIVDAQTRAGLAGEVALALRDIDGVDDARVIIAPAKLSEFADEHAHEATASVRIHVHPGTRLSPASVRGIKAFVAASVPELIPENVTLLDDRGLALGSQVPADDATGLQASLQSALDETFGAGATVVRVHADYSTTEREARDVRRLPLGSSPIVSRQSSESFDGAGKRYAKSESNDDRGSEIASTASRTQPGALVRVDTAVFVDASRSADLASIRDLAAATVGYDPRRGDVLDVRAVDFHQQRAPARDVSFMIYSALVPLLPVVAIIVGCIVAARIAFPHLATAVTYVAERGAVARTSRDVAAFSPARVRTVLAHEPPHTAAAIISALPTATAAAVLELYPAHEREAIVARMQRSRASIVPDLEEVLHDA